MADDLAGSIPVSSSKLSESAVADVESDISGSSASAMELKSVEVHGDCSGGISR